MPLSLNFDSSTSKFTTKYALTEITKVFGSIQNTGKFFDFSTLPMLDFSVQKSWVTANMLPVYYPTPWANPLATNLTNKDNCVAVLSLTVTSQYREAEFVVDTFDMLLGTMSGFAALVWLLAALFFSDYEQFKMDTSYIKSFFSSENAALDPEALDLAEG